VPPRAWSRVNNRCTYDTSYNEGYDPLVFERIAQINKGNVLQYKINSTQLTKRQRYSQIAKGLWTNRTKTFATQSDIYTNPNTTSLKRVNYVEYSRNDIKDPFNCPNVKFKDGGTLVCGTYQNPCTGQVIERVVQPNYHPNTDSDVPGPLKLLYWDPRLQTWYPKVRRTMNNSGNKWPLNYKLFTSALKPNPPILSIQNKTSNSITLSWTDQKSKCVPITNYQIFDVTNNKNTQIKILDYKVNTYTINNLTNNTNYSFYVISSSSSYNSIPSNIVESTTF
jgi:hypothetical protein